MKNDRMFPTKKQQEVYKLVHPDFEGLTIAQAAERLGITESSARRRLNNMREDFPEAFRFEKFDNQKVAGMSNIAQIYGGYKAKATNQGLEFTLTQDDVKELIQLECFNCGYLPNNSYAVDDYDDNYDHFNSEFAGMSIVNPSEYNKWAYDEETGYRFPYNHLWRYDVSKGFTYDNVITLCTKCIQKRRDQ